MADKPIIPNMTPWDADKEYQMQFNYSGGLPVSNRLIVYEDQTGAQVYDRTETSSHFYHTLVAGSLKIGDTGNGYKYRAQVIVSDNNGITSLISDRTYFDCLSAPVFRYLSPPSESVVVNKPAINMLILYTQDQDEVLDSFQHKLYNYSKQEIATSGVIYNKYGKEIPYIDYTFSGLENKTHYYIQSEGVTKKGIPVQTSLVHVFVDFEQQETKNVLNTYADEYGTVTGNLHVIAIDADENSEDYEYIGSQVVLLDQDIHYNKDFEIVGDFTCSLKARMTRGNKRLLKMNRKNTAGYIELTSFLYENNVVYHLKVNNGMTDYNLFSEPMNVSDNDEVLIHFRRLNNIYKLVVYKL